VTVALCCQSHSLIDSYGNLSGVVFGSINGTSFCFAMFFQIVVDFESGELNG